MTIDKIKQLKNLPIIFLDLNSMNEKFSEAFIEFNPEMESDIKSAAINKDCTCKNKILDYVRTYNKLCVEFLFNFLEKNIEVYNDVLNLERKHSPRNIQGKIAKTKMNDWKKFSDNIIESNCTFHSFSILKEGDELLVFFL
jgi:hypothetical protein